MKWLDFPEIYFTQRHILLIEFSWNLREYDYGYLTLLIALSECSSISTRNKLDFQKFQFLILIPFS